MKVRKNSLIKHRQQFGTKAACLEFLCQQKWAKGYSCKKCGNSLFYKGKMQYDRRCTVCAYNESPLCGTIFQSMKLDLVIAFEIVYRIAVSKKGLSCIEISREYDINQKSATLLRTKIQKAMASSQNYPLTGVIHVDEFFVGGPEKGKQGRSSTSKKKKATIAVEILPENKGIGRIYAVQIDDFSGSEIRKIFDKHISPTASVVADCWSSYGTLKELYPNLEQKKSEKGTNFPELHLMIMNLKSWIQGIHHHVSPQRFQDYLNEFAYRFNRRNTIESINVNLLCKMAKHKPFPAPKRPKVAKLVA